MLARLRTRGATPVTSRCTRYVALHPLRRGAPVTSRCTRSEEVQCLRIGCTASHNKHNRGQFVPTDPNRPPRTLRHSFDMLAQIPRKSRCTRYVALHPLRRGAPVTSRYTRSEGVQCLRIGCTASRNKPNRGHFLPTHPSGCIRRSHTTSKYPPGSEREALHPLRRNAPVTSQCTRSEGVPCLRIGCTAT